MSKDIKKNKEKYKNDDKDKTSSTTKKRLSKKRLLILVLIILIIISPIVLLTVAHFSKIKESSLLSFLLDEYCENWIVFVSLILLSRIFYLYFLILILKIV